MVRGGRSWPSETKLGGRSAERSGNDAVEVERLRERRRRCSPAASASKYAEHRLHLSCAPRRDAVVAVAARAHAERGRGRSACSAVHRMVDAPASELAVDVTGTPGRGRRAQHGRSHRAPDGEQHGQQQQQPDAERFHGDRVLRGRHMTDVKRRACRRVSRLSGQAQALTFHGGKVELTASNDGERHADLARQGRSPT